MSISAAKAAFSVLFAAGARSSAGAGSKAARQTKIFALFPLLLGLTGFSPGAAAAEILIEPRVGFHGVFQLGRPFPLEVNLENIGPPAEGILEIEVWKGGAAQGGVPYRDLSSPRSFPAGALAPDRAVHDRPGLAQPPAENPVHQLRRRRASRELDLRRHFSPAPVVLSVSEGSAVPLTSLGASLDQPGRRAGAVPNCRRKRGPCSAFPTSSFTICRCAIFPARRSAALDDWLAAGGRMVIIGSLNFTLYQEPQLGRYLPVRVTGVKRTAFAPPGDARKARRHRRRVGSDRDAS